MTTEPTGRGPADAPRTLAEALRAQPDEALARLLRARPDLLSPLPGDLTELATRATTRASVVRALERLDRFALQTAEALTVAPDPCPCDVLAALLPGADAAAALPRALRTLRERAFVWGDGSRLRLVRTVRELLTPTATRPGTTATGLGPPLAEAAAGMSPGRLQEILATVGLPPTHDPVSAVAALSELFRDRERMAALLDEAPEAAAKALEKLVWGPPYGAVSATSAAGAGGSPGGPGGPIGWLLGRGLLLPSGPRTVVLPREVALQLRGGRVHRATEPWPPAVGSGAARPPHSVDSVDSAAAGQAHAAVTAVEELLKLWENAPPPVLRAGGLGVRELKRTALALEVSEPLAAFWVELALAAGLLASDGEADERCAPTPAYDEWLRQPPEQRWAALVAAWLPATRVPGLVGTRDTKGRTRVALGPGLDRSAAPEIRRRVLELLAGTAEGSTAGAAELLARLAWERPLRPPKELREQLVGWTLTEAELLGVTGRGAVPSFARALFPAVPAPAPIPGPAAASVAEAADSGARNGAGPGARSGAGPGARNGAGPGARNGAGPHARTGTVATATATGAATGAAAAGSATAGPTAVPPANSAAVSPADPTADPAAVAAAVEWAAPPTAAEIATAAGRAAARLAPLLPQPLDQVLLQADLTAVAPGPLERPLAAMLELLADVESKGGATVYRFTPSSVRRALDAGHPADDIHTFLTARSRTPVPQPLSYLVDDVARRHGRLRVGVASAYLRCDDDALLAELLADRRAAVLGLRRLAPTVLAAGSPPEQVLARLRELGYAPAAESAGGEVLITRADARRTPPRTAPEPVPDGPPVPDEPLLSRAVRAIRAGDRAVTVARKPSPATAASPDPRPGDGLPRTTAADTLATMQSATLAGAPVLIGHVAADGTATRRVITPVRVEGGVVTAYDHTAEGVRTFPLHRITGAAELVDG